VNRRADGVAAHQTQQPHHQENDGDGRQDGLSPSNRDRLTLREHYTHATQIVMYRTVQVLHRDVPA
jgi:hypothetical protein